MKNSMKILAMTLIVACASSFTVIAQNVTTVGGEKMYSTKNIIENALKSADHTTLVAAVKAGELVDVLMGPGPFTVFAPTNDAFENLPDGTVATLLKPENKAMLVSVLTYHVVAGNYNFSALMAGIKKNNGKLTLKTVNGQDLNFTANGDHNITVWDANGNAANISIYDVAQSNGVIQVIDKVLLPKS